MKKRKYFYAISYHMSNSEGSTGSGCAQVYLDYRVKDIPTFNAMHAFLQEKNDFKTLVITNIMYLGRVWA